MVTTSEVAVSVTIDSDLHLDEIIAELNNIASIEVEKNQTIVSIVGNEIAKTDAVLKKLFDAINEISTFTYFGKLATSTVSLAGAVASLK